MKAEIEELLHDGYKILEVMYDNKIEYKKDSFKSELSRDTLAELTGYKEHRVRYLTNQLVKLKYLQKLGKKRSQYIITEKAILAIKVLK